ALAARVACAEARRLIQGWGASGGTASATAAGGGASGGGTSLGVVARPLERFAVAIRPALLPRRPPPRACARGLAGGPRPSPSFPGGAAPEVTDRSRPVLPCEARLTTP